MQKYEKLETLIEPVFILEGNLDIFFFFITNKSHTYLIFPGLR